MATSPNKDLELTNREQTILATAWTCIEGDVKVDYDKLATGLGMSNPRSASNALAAIKKKINLMTGTNVNKDVNGGANGTTAANTKKRGRKSKGTAAASTAAEPSSATVTDADDQPSPAKKSKGGASSGKKRTVKVKKEQDEVDDEQEDVFT